MDGQSLNKRCVYASKKKHYHNEPWSFCTLQGSSKAVDKPLIPQKVTSQVKIAVVNENANVWLQKIIVEFAHFLVFVAICLTNESAAEVPFFNLWRHMKSWDVQFFLRNIFYPFFYKIKTSFKVKLFFRAAYRVYSVHCTPPPPNAWEGPLTKSKEKKSFDYEIDL